MASSSITMNPSSVLPTPRKANESQVGVHASTVPVNANVAAVTWTLAVSENAARIEPIQAGLERMAILECFIPNTPLTYLIPGCDTGHLPGILVRSCGNGSTGQR